MIIGISVPSFVFASVGQLILVVINQVLGFNVLPVAGWGDISHMLVPALVLGLGTMAFLTRLMRSSMLEIVSADFIRTARSKGVYLLRKSSRDTNCGMLYCRSLRFWVHRSRRLRPEGSSLRTSSVFPDLDSPSCLLYSKAITASSWARRCSMVRSWY